MRKGIKGVILVLFLLLLIVTTSVFAERPAEGIGKWLQEVGVFTGYMNGSLRAQKHFESVPVGLRFGFDLKPFTKKFGLDPKGMLELVYEPFINTITQPRTNAEIALAFLLKYAYPLTEKFYPYIEIGSGFDYMTLHVYEEGMQFNFVDQGGAGIYYFFKKDLALNLGYRFRHLSNCGTAKPNAGIQSHEYLVGLSYFF